MNKRFIFYFFLIVTILKRYGSSHSPFCLLDEKKSTNPWMSSVSTERFTSTARVLGTFLSLGQPKSFSQFSRYTYERVEAEAEWPHDHLVFDVCVKWQGKSGNSVDGRVIGLLE